MKFEKRYSMANIILKVPTIEELLYRQTLLNTEKTNFIFDKKSKARQLLITKGMYFKGQKLF